MLAWLGEMTALERPPSPPTLIASCCTTPVEIEAPANVTGCRSGRSTLQHTAHYTTLSPSGHTDGDSVTRMDMTPAARRMLWCGNLYGSSSAGHSNHHRRDLSIWQGRGKLSRTRVCLRLRWSLCTCAGLSLSAASPAPGTKRGRLHVERHPGARHKPIVRRAPGPGATVSQIRLCDRRSS